MLQEAACGNPVSQFNDPEVSGLQLGREEVAKVRVVLHEKNAVVVVHKRDGGLSAILWSSPRNCPAQRQVWIADTKR